MWLYLSARTTGLSFLIDVVLTLYMGDTRELHYIETQNVHEMKGTEDAPLYTTQIWPNPSNECHNI